MVLLFLCSYAGGLSSLQNTLAESIFLIITLGSPTKSNKECCTAYALIPTFLMHVCDSFHFVDFSFLCLHLLSLH